MICCCCQSCQGLIVVIDRKTSSTIIADFCESTLLISRDMTALQLDISCETNYFNFNISLTILFELWIYESFVSTWIVRWSAFFSKIVWSNYTCFVKMKEKFWDNGDDGKFCFCKGATCFETFMAKFNSNLFFPEALFGKYFLYPKIQIIEAFHPHEVFAF